MWYLGVPNDVFPGARTVVPIAVSPAPAPDVPGSIVFSQSYDDWYSEHVVAPGLLDYRTVPAILDRLWKSQAAIQRYLAPVP